MKIPSFFLKDNITYSLSQALRTGHFFGMSVLAKAYLGHLSKSEIEFSDLKLLFRDLFELYKSDLKNINDGLYLGPEGFEELAMPDCLEAVGKILLDLRQVKRRIRENDVKVFKVDKNPELPTYFNQSFHYQTDGYLSKRSAELYDHQVEIVFLGAGKAVRRHALVPIRNFVEKHGKRVEPIRYLDVACGTGQLPREVKRNFPEFSVEACDLSPWYLEEALQRNKDLDIDWKKENAEEMSYADNSFDIVSCVYLFHELPELARKKAARELLRVLKPGGLLLHLDSLQLGDKKDSDKFLKMFPTEYHEPYYMNYVQNPVKDLFSDIDSQSLVESLVYNTKILSATKKN